MEHIVSKKPLSERIARVETHGNNLGSKLAHETCRGRQTVLGTYPVNKSGPQKIIVGVK